MKTYGQKHSELTLYAVLWAMLYAASAFSVYVGKVSSHASRFDWNGLFSSWRLLTLFLAAFCLHNFLAAPLLVYRNRRRQYALAAVLIVAGFVAVQALVRPNRPQGMEPPARPAEELYTAPAKPAGKTGMEPPARPGEERRMNPPAKPDGEGTGGGAARHEPPLAFGGQDSVALIIFSLLLGLNVGAKYYFKSVDDRKRFDALERDSLNAQLSYLKYQINPHFFMNTLNNIHALVLIDPETANRMIETLSKLMRYVLYDGNRSLAPLKKELDFVENFVELMRVRYTENVRISMHLPDEVPDVYVPSLLFATFIENAFKHGVSYESDSFIEIAIRADTGSGVLFTCRNSRLPQQADPHGGVGLANARKRLQLIYGSGYTLSITPTDREYSVELRLPARRAQEVPGMTSCQAAARACRRPS